MDWFVVYTHSMNSPYKEHFIPTNGINLHTIVTGPEDGSVVILLHGFPSFWLSWRYQIPVLAEAGYRVIVPDQRGYNLSDKDGPYDIDTLVDDVVGLIRWSGQGQVYLVGHDWGAAVAWMAAAKHPELIQKLVILNVPHPVVMTRALKGKNLTQILKVLVYSLFPDSQTAGVVVKCRELPKPETDDAQQRE